MNRNFNKELNALFLNLTTGQLLFELAYECNSLGNYGQPVNITVNANGVNTACISQVRVLTWDMTCHDLGAHSGCEFLEAPKQPTFGFQNAHSISDPLQFSVPSSYLGPGLTQAKPLLKRD